MWKRIFQFASGAEICVGGAMSIWPEIPKVWGYPILAFGALVMITSAMGWYHDLKLPNKGDITWKNMWSLKIHKEDIFPIRKFITLRKASEYVYTRIGNIFLKFYVDNSRLVDDPIKFIAHHMIYTKELPLYGTRPHSKKLELIGDDAAIGWNQISDNLEKIEDPEGIKVLPLYENLQMKIADVKQFIKTERRAKNG